MIMATATKKTVPAKAVKSTPAKSAPIPAKEDAKASPKEGAAKSAPVKEYVKDEAPKKSGVYRNVDGFMDALKAAKSAAKGGSPLGAPLRLITHLAWKTPGGTVGWTKGTTPEVIEYADDMALATGTSIPEAMRVALAECDKHAETAEEKGTVKVLADLIKSH